MNKYYFLWVIGLMLATPALAQKPAAPKKNPTADPAPTPEKELLSGPVLGALKFRSIGPALTSGRVIDFAVNPLKPAEYFVAAASGGVWKTVNAGTTYEPVFDGEGSYSIGCLAMDPQNSSVIWVGTGENNAQRSVAYGDGVYKSTDGGKTWKNMGLKQSEHIGKILVHPRNSQVVFVAAQGPLWAPGGDRGLYKTQDGGKTWRKVLDISENTGVNEVICDPRNPDIMYASSWQRRRHVWTLISGGPETAMYKSTDGGETWEKSMSGLPSGDLGRIGLAISPINPDIVYAVIEASENGGLYRSADQGASWQKRSGTYTSGNYYQELVADPHQIDRIYLMDTYLKVSDDGGTTFRNLGEKSKHVDNHAMWIDPQHPDHYLVGCDGGIYETWDRAKTWNYKPNLPITQFYKVALDRSEPFYYVYGGTQDNFSLGGPSRTTHISGITNEDWFVTNGGDGFESQVDPVNPDIVYAQAQYGYLVRFDRKSGESIFIQPQPGKGEDAYRWNWDAPLLISPHSPQRIYFGANKLFRSDDRGNTWQVISPDLTRQLDRNALPVMGRVWSMDAVAKNQSTSIYGNTTALSESPVQPGLLYVGTDDGLVQVSDNDGGAWRKLESFPGVPERTYVNMLLASRHEAQTVYAAFNNHKNGDFKPYLLKSTDKGVTWTSITGNLPARGSVYCIAEDPKLPSLLFAGTEFGVYVTLDGGQKWTQLKGGLPTIAVRDMEIHPAENDLVLATFGRGFYVLDDYSPLRSLSRELLDKPAHIFPVSEALLYIPSRPQGLRGKSFLGESFYLGENPAVGAVFTLYLKEGLKTSKQLRQEAEKKALEAKQSITYPTADQIRQEDLEEAPYLLVTILDKNKSVVTRIKTGANAGTQRITWNFRYPSTAPVSLRNQDSDDPFSDPETGYLALPGTYYVSLSQVVNGQTTELVAPQAFEVKSLQNTTLPATDVAAREAFLIELSELRRRILGATTLLGELTNKVKHAKAAVYATPDAPISLLNTIRGLELRLAEISRQLNGDASLARREFPVPPGIVDRIETAVYGLWGSTSAPTTTQREAVRIAREDFGMVQTALEALVRDLRQLEQDLSQYQAPYTPGRG
ncbi:MAG: glycosyl hydrolase [Bacteroidia bacterium]|nr:glycosyl hydrolase [Bacteroidia bacterium]